MLGRGFERDSQRIATRATQLDMSRAGTLGKPLSQLLREIGDGNAKQFTRTLDHSIERRHATGQRDHLAVGAHIVARRPER